MFTCELYNRSGIRIASSLDLRPIFYSFHNIGGPEKAEIAVAGERQALQTVMRWLDYKIVIINDVGDPVWWGRIEEATINRGGTEKGVNLDSMANRVKVLYTTEDGDGNSVAVETDWAEHAYSVAIYGEHELRHSLGDALADQAETARDALLDALAFPQPTTVSARGDIFATLRAVGAYHTLEREYYANDVGRVVFDESGDSTQPVGWGIVSDADICFGDNSLQDMSARLSGLADEVQLRVSGTTSNNGAHTCDGAVQGDKAQSYAASTIYFDATDDIHDSAKGLNIFSAGFVVEVSGTTSNDGHHLIETQENRGHITTENDFSGTEITNESSGTEFTITRGQKIRLEDGCTNESVGTITVYAAGKQLAYSVSHTGTAFTVAEILIRLRRVGNPSDSVRVSFYDDDSGPDTQLDTATVSGTALSLNMGWVSFAFTNTISFAASTTFWIVVERTGSDDPEDFYEVALEEEEDGGGTLKLNDSQAWLDRTTDAHLPYQIWGAVEIGEQIVDIQDDAPGRTAGASVRVDTGVDTRQYRDGSEVALDEIEALLEVGTSSGDRLRAYCDIDEILIVDTEADEDLPTLRLEEDGTLTRWGRPLQPGELPVGEWAEDAEMPADPSIGSSSPIYIEWAQYNIERGQIDWRERGAPDVFDLDSIVQG